jgi:CubicO group peptidase (beta-lactamase class C family)
MDGIFPLGSISKVLTAAAIMCLVEDGLLGLNRPVQEYVPEFVGDGKEAVMVHHLLTHTSGIRDGDLDAYARAAIRAETMSAPPPLPYLGPEDWLYVRCFDEVHGAPLSKAPGEEMSYCSYGYRLLAEIATRVSGMPVDAFAQQRIFDPLGMTGTSFSGLPLERRDRFVRIVPPPPFSLVGRPEAMGCGHGMASACSTALDLAAFGQLFLNQGAYGETRVLSPVTVAEMTRNQIPGISALWAGEYFPEASWGYGWDIQGNKKSGREGSLISSTAFGHGGSGMNKIWVDPVYDVVIVYLSITKRMATPRKGDWCADLFINAAMASIVD